jgi:hypothetical protein
MSTARFSSLTPLDITPSAIAAGKIPISLFKVFSATKARDRETLGDRVTAWIEANPRIEVLNTVVSLSSDRAFHCLSLVLICADRAASPA